MPYATFQRAKYDRLNKPMTVADIVVNWLIKDHNSKVSLDCQLRPTYSPQGTALLRDGGMKSQVVVQYQIYF